MQIHGWNMPCSIRLCIDNAKAHLAGNVLHKLVDTLGCSLNFGSVATPETRGIIERFFGTLETRGFHRLPGTTGSNIYDTKRKNPQEEAVRYNITFEQITELMEVLIAEYNNTPHSSLKNETPLECLTRKLQNPFCRPTIASEELKNEIHAYGYEAFSKIDLLSPCLTEELPFPENLPDLPYNMIYISAPQEYISKMKVPAFREFSEFKLIAKSGKDLKLKYSKMLETIADKLNGTAEEKDLAKQYMPDNLDMETDFYNLMLFLLVQKKLACYNKEEVQQGIAYVNGSNQKDANPDIVRLIQFAQNIFHCKDTQTIFQRKIFSFDLLFSKYNILDNKRSNKKNYPVYLIAERTDGYIGYYLLS